MKPGTPATKLMHYAGFFCFVVASLFSLNAQAKLSHALILFGEPKYAADFKHFDYVNPNAPKGGTVRLSTPATFDSLNPFILKGLAAPGSGLLFETLMTSSSDEPQTYYGLIAEKVDLAEDGSSITFDINPKAHWHDGTPITVADIIFSFETLKKDGHPQYRILYDPVESVKTTGERKITFYFSDSSNRDLPFIVAGMPVISKAYYSEHDFTKTSLKSPMGSGPYRVGKVDAGRSISYKRVDDYWGADVPSQKGFYNYNRIRYDVYRDETVALEAFKAHEYDFREEYIARNWATAYDFPAVHRGDVIIDNTPNKIPRGMQAFIYNLRKDKFSDVRVREAISQTLDFEWLNRTIFYDAYFRNDSFFQNTDFAALGLPDENEMDLLARYRRVIPRDVFIKPYQVPYSDGSGSNRNNLLKAQALLNEAGWVIRDGKRVHKETGEHLSLVILLRQSTFKRVVMPMIKGLKRLGIDARLRLVDDSQYQKRIDSRDFDLVTIWWNLNLKFPGNEQIGFWHSSQANVPGSKNLSGLENKAVDAMLAKIASASDYDELKYAARALDRILLHQHLVIPHWSINHFRMAYWDVFGIPDKRPIYADGFNSWWLKEYEK